MADRSAGIVVWRRRTGGGVTGPVIEVVLGHMGGPFWARKDDGAWSIPKGLIDPDEEPVDAACREFVEELGLALPPGELVDLGEIRQSSRKTVAVWALELSPAVTLALDAIDGNLFEIEWPPRSGRMESFPETDRAAWFDLDTARRKVVGGQDAVFDLLEAAVDAT